MCNFYDPVEINGKIFEREDAKQAAVRVLIQLQRAGSRPAEEKRRAAKFLLSVCAERIITLSDNVRKYCERLILLN